MPRPSLKEERRNQILEAYEKCVARFGVEGASLELIAEEAGLARALIRHNVGNRKDLLAALVERFLEKSDHGTRMLLDTLPNENRLATLVEWLFDPRFMDPTLVLVSEALIATSSEHPEIAEKMRMWTEDFVSRVAKVIAREYPKAKKDKVRAVAAGLTAIYFNVDSMSPLGPMPALVKASKEAALILIESLES